MNASAFSIPTKTQTKDFYTFHVIGTTNTFIYDVKKQVVKGYDCGVLFSKAEVCLTAEQFFADAKIIFLKALALNDRLN
jgi:hypothetical protein